MKKTQLRLAINGNATITEVRITKDVLSHSLNTNVTHELGWYSFNSIDDTCCGTAKPTTSELGYFLCVGCQWVFFPS
jgi:hypothetical protein